MLRVVARASSSSPARLVFPSPMINGPQRGDRQMTDRTVIERARQPRASRRGWRPVGVTQHPSVQAAWIAQVTTGGTRRNAATGWDRGSPESYRSIPRSR